MRHFISISLLLFIFIIACGCSTRDLADSDQQENGCICTMQYDPVCGSDGQTYGNACIAECEGITEYTDGECNE